MLTGLTTDSKQTPLSIDMEYKVTLPDKGYFISTAA